MSGDVREVRHPVPFTLLRRRGARRQVELVETVSRVAIPHVSPSEVRAGPTMTGRRERWEFGEIEGRLFVRATPPGSHATAGELLLELAREGAEPRSSTFDKAIARTPLSAQVPTHDADGRPIARHLHDYRGVPLDSLDGREVVEDGTVAARARLAAWVEANVRVAGDDLYVDTGGPLFRGGQPGESLNHDAIAFPRLAPVRGECLQGPLTLREAIERRASQLEAHTGLHRDLIPERDLEILVLPLPGSEAVSTDTDLLFANLVPGIVIDLAGPGLRSRFLAEDSPTLAGTRLRSLALHGAIGAIEEADAIGAVGIAMHAAREASRMDKVRNAFGEPLLLLERHVEQWVLPRLRARRDMAVEADGAALDALLP